MKKKIYIALASILLTTCIAVSSVKAEIFSYEIKVTGQGVNSQQSKSKAITEYRKVALERVITKILTKRHLEAYRSKLSFDHPSFESGISIREEQLTNSGYSSIVNYRFDKNKVMDYLSSLEIPHLGGNQVATYLSIISFDRGTLSQNEINSWNDNWLNKGENYFTSKFIYYNLQNKQILEDQDYLQDLYSNLQVNGIVEFLLSKNESGLYNISIVNYTTKKTSFIENMPTVEAAFFKAAIKAEDDIKNFIIERQETRAIEEDLEISYQSMEELAYIRETLLGIPGVRFIQYIEIGPNYNKIKISYSENLKTLQEKVDNLGLVLDIDNLIISQAY